MRLTNVVFPDPFGPIMPNNSPLWRSKLTPTTARTPPKLLLTFRTLRIISRLSILAASFINLGPLLIVAGGVSLPLPPTARTADICAGYSGKSLPEVKL